VADLSIRDLRVVRGGRPILDACGGEFPGGRRTVLWGPSGAGKSTLLNAIAGLIVPDAGVIALGPETLFSSHDGVDVRPHRRRIGYVFQDLALWPHLTVIDQVRLVGQGVGLDVAGASRILESVGLETKARRRPGQLSGGEQQRLAIARAVAGKPAILLLDEPFSSVDRQVRSSLYELIRAVSPSVAGPTIYVTHDAEDAASLAEHAIRLTAGTFVGGGRPWEHDE
jgi:ABC-type sulfate/molybdate transport systems ATPase subunit